jgi:hypothetical protein
MKQLMLFAGLALVLLGAFVVQRQLTAPIEPPPVTQLPAPAPLPPPLRAELPPPPAPAPPVQPAQAVTAAPTLIPLPPTTTPPPAGAEEESAFTADNAREIEYAFQLAIGPSSTVESAKNAAEVFERCLKQFPTNARCQQGLETAQQRLQDPNWKPRAAPPPLLLSNHPRPGPPQRGLPGFGQVRTRLPVHPEEPDESPK